MASTVPAKSQPLHNFTLPHLKWNKDRNSSGQNQHQRRRSIKSPSRRPNISAASPVRHSPLRDSVSATPPRYQSPLRDSIAAAAASPRGSPPHGDYLVKRSPTLGESSKPHSLRDWRKHSSGGGDQARHSPRHGSAPDSEASGKGKGVFVEHRRNHSNNSTSDGARNGIHSTDAGRTTQKSEAKSKAKEVDAAGTKRSKILIKIPCKSSKMEDENPHQEPLKTVNNDVADCTGEVKEDKINNNNIDEETKTWNLRPRKPIHKSLNVNGGHVKNNGLALPAKSKAQSPSRSLNNRSGENDGGSGGKKEKRKLSISISLTKEEIQEDIFALTGSKPARRPNKRPKSIQKQVDVCFPGSWLVSITADSYKVSENSLKS